jgi:hypothetical protein
MPCKRGGQRGLYGRWRLGATRSTHLGKPRCALRVLLSILELWFTDVRELVAFRGSSHCVPSACSVVDASPHSHSRCPSLFNRCRGHLSGSPSTRMPTDVRGSGHHGRHHDATLARLAARRGRVLLRHPQYIERLISASGDARPRHRSYARFRPSAMRRS